MVNELVAVVHDATVNPILPKVILATWLRM
jgi:hypothetical protein